MLGFGAISEAPISALPNTGPGAGFLGSGLVSGAGTAIKRSAGAFTGKGRLTDRSLVANGSAAFVGRGLLAGQGSRVVAAGAMEFVGRGVLAGAPVTGLSSVFTDPRARIVYAVELTAWAVSDRNAQ